MNLVVYVADALRVDHLGCYGGRFLNTRTADELASDGARFDQTISAAPWTCPSMMSIVTGLYAHRHGVLHWDSELDRARPNLFTAVAGLGHAVGSFVFDESYLFRGLREANVHGTSESLDPAISWLRAHRSRPFLLFVHSWATHMPYGVLHSERRRWRDSKRQILEGIQGNTADALESLREQYRAAVELQSEVLLASLLDELDRLGLRERTAIAFLSDHGESWGERFAEKEQVTGIYFMHGATVYDEVVQVPLILSAPGRIEPGVVRSQVRSVDLAPTLVELADGMPEERIDGRSLLPLIDGLEAGDRSALIAATDRGALSQLALRVPPWKIILHARSGREEAYRLDLDPRERLSRPGDAPAELKRALRHELDETASADLTAEEEAIVVERLTNLGYL